MTTPPTRTARADGYCCDEYAKMAVTRRGLLGGAAALAGATTMVGGAVVTASPARAASAASVLVVVSLRGGADGLSLVVPHGDPGYYAARPGIAIPPLPLLEKDSFFGLHPAMTDLVPLWQEGILAAVHATGLPVANRSHFAAMEEMEDADPGSSARVGWLNRLVSGTPGSSPLQGFSAGTSTIPTSLVGPASTMSAGRVDDVELPGSDEDGRRQKSLQTMWHREKSTLGRSMRTTFEAIHAFGPAQGAVDNRATYPGSGLGAVARHGCPDHPGRRRCRGDHRRPGRLGHAHRHGRPGQRLDVEQRQGPRRGDRGVLRRSRDPEEQGHPGDAERVRPPGRRERQQRHRPWLRQRHVRGRSGRQRWQYHASWPGLANSYDADLTVTTDYRQVLADIVSKRFNASVAKVFPGLKWQRTSVMS